MINDDVDDVDDDDAGDADDADDDDVDDDAGDDIHMFIPVKGEGEGAKSLLF